MEAAARGLAATRVTQSICNIDYNYYMPLCNLSLSYGPEGYAMRLSYGARVDSVLRASLVDLGTRRRR